MPSTAASKPITKTRVARVPYLNSVPFFRGLPLRDGYEFLDCVPSELGQRAAAGEILAGPLPLVEYFRLEETFERLGRFGIAVRGRGHSAILFGRRPIRQLDGAVIAVTEETSSTFCLLRLLLEQRYQIHPASYDRVRVPPMLRFASPRECFAFHGGSATARRGRSQDADALLLIGDEALRFRQANKQYPFEIDVAFEWWLWQHLPFVFAVWAIRRDAGKEGKRQIELSLARSLALNTNQFEPIARDYSKTLGIPAAQLQAYLSNFIYRLSQPEEEAITRFRDLLEQTGLMPDRNA